MLRESSLISCYHLGYHVVSCLIPENLKGQDYVYQHPFRAGHNFCSYYQHFRSLCSCGRHIILKTPPERSLMQFKMCRRFTDDNLRTFNCLMKSESWKDVFGAVDLDEAFSHFHFTVGYYFNTTFPLKKSKICCLLSSISCTKVNFPDTLKLLVSKLILKGKGCGITLTTTISILSTFSKEIRSYFSGGCLPF